MTTGRINQVTTAGRAHRGTPSEPPATQGGATGGQLRQAQHQITTALQTLREMQRPAAGVLRHGRGGRPTHPDAPEESTHEASTWGGEPTRTHATVATVQPRQATTGERAGAGERRRHLRGAPPSLPQPATPNTHRRRGGGACRDRTRGDEGSPAAPHHNQRQRSVCIRSFSTQQQLLRLQPLGVGHRQFCVFRLFDTFSPET